MNELRVYIPKTQNVLEQMTKQIEQGRMQWNYKEVHR